MSRTCEAISRTRAARLFCGAQGGDRSGCSERRRDGGHARKLVNSVNWKSLGKHAEMT